MSEEEARRSSGESDGEEEVKEVTATLNNTSAPAPENPADGPKEASEPAPTLAPFQTNAPGKGRGGKTAKPTKRVQLKLPLNNASNDSNHVSPDAVKEPVESTTQDEVEDAETEEEEEEEQEEVVAAPSFDFSKILRSCLALVGFFGAVLRQCASYVRAGVMRVWEWVRASLPCALAVGVFVLISHLVEAYVVDLEGERVGDFTDRMEYVVRQLALVASPTVMGLLVQRLRPGNKRTRVQSLDDTLLLSLNLLIFASHIPRECFVDIYVIIIVTTAYRLSSLTVQTFCSSSGGSCTSSIQYFLTTPIQLSHIVLGLYNVYSIVGKDLGLFSPSTASVEVQTEGEPGSAAGWY